MLISLSQAIEPVGGYTTVSVTHGQCDARHTVTFPVNGRYQFIRLCEQRHIVVHECNRQTDRQNCCNTHCRLHSYATHCMVKRLLLSTSLRAFIRALKCSDFNMRSMTLNRRLSICWTSSGESFKQISFIVDNISPTLAAFCMHTINTIGQKIHTKIIIPIFIR